MAFNPCRVPPIVEKTSHSEINAARFTTSDIPRIHGSDQSKYTGVRIYSL